MLITNVGNNQNSKRDALFFWRRTISLAMLPFLAISMLGCTPVAETSFRVARRAIKENDIQKLKQVLGAMEIDDQVKEYDDFFEPTEGYTLLHFAVEENRLEMVNYLLESGANPNLHMKYDQSTPLMLAISLLPPDENAFQIVSSLVKYGADVNAIKEGGRRPLHLCRSDDYIKYCELLLLNGADVDAKADTGSTPLHFATYGKYKSIVALLLQHGADASFKNDYGRSALDYATESGDAALMKVLSGTSKNLNTDARK